MRNAFVKKLTEMAHHNSNIYLLLPDIGVWLFKNAGFPRDRLINTGICEQNSIGVAVGLALSGKLPFVYTIAPFATCRCYDQIRYSVAYHNLPITIVGVGAGLCYSKEGPSHHSIEDMAIMRALPNMNVYSPCCIADVNYVLVAGKSPSYIRLSIGESGANIIPYSNTSKTAILATGRMVQYALKASKNSDVNVYSICDIKPLDERVYDILVRHKNIVTIEEHNIVGGLGSAVAEVIADNGLCCKLTRMGVHDKFISEYGSNEFVLKKAGLSVGDIRNVIESV